jgi:hypothetical protein
MNYSTEDLKNLGEYLKSAASGALKKEPSDSDLNQQLMTIYRQLEVIRFNPLLFKTILKNYKVDYALMEVPLRDVTLHINDAGDISKTLVRWRLSNNR